MEYKNLMTEAIQIFNDRNARYGDMRICMDRAAQIATLITGIHLTPHDIALVLHALKLARLGNDRANPENYIDGINYYAFAGELISVQEEHSTIIQDVEKAINPDLEELRSVVEPERHETNY
jgi:hypothetical protein